MLGTIVNTAAVLLGGLLGLLAKNGLKENWKGIINQGMGLAVIFVGASGALKEMLTPQANPILFIVAIALGGLLGEMLGIEAGLQRMGDWLQGKMRFAGGKDASQPSRDAAAGGAFSQGFVAASLIFCVGTMTVLGSFESGVKGEHTILFAKSVLDGIVAVVLASTYGAGVLFSGLTVLVYQGLLTLLAVWVSPWLTADMLREMSIVGGILIVGIGLNLLEVTKIRVANFLPAVFLPVVYYAVTGLFA